MKKIPISAILVGAIVLAFVLSLSPISVGPFSLGPIPMRAMAAPSHVPSAKSADRALALGRDVSPVTASPKASAAGEIIASADMLGFSGRLRAVTGTHAALEQNPLLKPLLGSDDVDGAASWPKLSTAEGDSFTVVTLVPISEADRAGFGRYHVGSWPHDALTSSAARYTPPSGFIGVTQQNQRTRMSQSFTMGDFLTHDQGNVWPKVLVLQPRILDKLELLRAELEREGYPNRLHVMSGFRTPQYNAQGVGEGGRATHSRHMYGDAADVFVDADGNGWMDDLNGDGKVDVADARVLRGAAEKVEAKYPSLIGGIAAYPSNGVHGPFVHVDARGVKARWGE